MPTLNGVLQRPTSKVEESGPVIETWIMSDPYIDLFTRVLKRQRDGFGCLPFYLGLDPLELMAVLQDYDCDDVAVIDMVDPNAESQQEAWLRGSLRQELLEMRRDEWNDIRELLLRYRANQHPLEAVFASMVAAGCLGGDHLWRDLGLETRSHLSELIGLNFPALAEKNSRDMKWKKFFYKQLCEAEGGYVCRSPSCEQCAAYTDCFGPEH